MSVKGKSSVVFFFLLMATVVAQSGTVNVGISLQPFQVNTSNATQLNLPIVDVITNNSPNISISIPISYFESGLSNLTLQDDAFGYTNGYGYRINESIVLKTPTISGNMISWEANLTAGGAWLQFNVSPATLTVDSISINGNVYSKNFTVSSPNPLKNVSVIIDVNDSYRAYSLLYLSGGAYQNETSALHLVTSLPNASFHGFNTSDQVFSLRALLCAESWVCGGWSDSGNSCGTRTCTDSNSCGTEISKPAETAGCPSSSSSTSGGGSSGGGGGGGLPTTPTPDDSQISESKLSFSVESITEKIIGNKSVNRQIGLLNTGDSNLSVTIDLSDVSDFLLFSNGMSEISIDINADTAATLNVTFFTSHLIDAGVYSGVITAKAPGVQETLYIVLEFEPVTPLFDIELLVPDRYRFLQPGQEIFTEVRLIDLSNLGPVEVTLLYTIIDKQRNVITRTTETIIVDGDATFTTSFILPLNTAEGKYLLTVEALYKESVGVSSASFNVFGGNGQGLLGATSPLAIVLFLILTVFMGVAVLGLYHMISPTAEPITHTTQPKEDLDKTVKYARDHLREMLKKK